MPKPHCHFPFAAVAGQTQFKLALLLTAINPLIGGVLISGPRGSAKSTLAKSLADIMPEHEGQTRRFVTLPLGATEEMLIGTLNLQHVLEEKRVVFQGGLLAKAHNGVLYVDEVNLLPDNLVDQLLDVAASGMNTVERDGISHQHAAEFILLGTMNPDEGELRPQFIDRFGLSVNLSNQYTIEERIEIVKLRESFDKNPSGFGTQYKSRQQQLKQQILTAQQRLPTVVCDDTCRQLIAERCLQACVDGLRADIAWTQAAAAHASLHQRNNVTKDDVLAVELLVLNHRRNNDKQDQNPTGRQPEKKPFSRPIEKGETSSSAEHNNQNVEGDWGAMCAESQSQPIQQLQTIKLSNTVDSVVKEKSVLCQLFTPNRLNGNANGMRQSINKSHKVNWFSTLLHNTSLTKLAHLHFFNKKQGNIIVHLILLDTSASILNHQSFSKAKGLILQMAKSAYLRREQFILIGFGNQQVKTLMDMRRAPKAIEQFLNNLEASGGTPLQAALKQAKKCQQQQLRKHHQLYFKNTLITDGRVSQLDFNEHLQGDTVVIDVEQSAVKRGKSQQLAQWLNGRYTSLLELTQSPLL